MHSRRSTDYTVTVTPDGKSILERRSADRDGSVEVVKLISGDCYYTDKPGRMIVTILGSCIAACMRDPVLKIGGMNHFLLPESSDSSIKHTSESARYGAFAMEQLINGIVGLGGVKSRLEVKLFGGGNVINNSAMIGSRNVAFVKQFLKDEKLVCVSEDLGDTYPRRLRYYPDTGKVMLMKLRRRDDMAVIDEETNFATALKAKPLEGAIELF